MKKEIIVIVFIVVLIYGCSKGQMPVFECHESDSSDECNRQKSVAFNDESHCANIQDAELRINCYASIAAFKQNFKVCDNLADLERDFCLKIYGSAKRDLAACNAILDSNQKDLCVRNVAIAQKDQNLCGEVIQEGQKELCISSINQV